MAVNHVQALDSYPMDGWRSSRTHPLARRETLTGPQVRILHHPLHGAPGNPQHPKRHDPPNACRICGNNRKLHRCRSSWGAWMVRSTADYYTLTIKTRKKNPNIPRNVLDVGGGYSVLAYLCSYLEYAEKSILKDEKKERIYSVSGYEIHGRLVLIDVLSGQYGEQDQLLDMLHGYVTSIGPEQTTVKHTRIVFCCPVGDDVKMAIFAVEHVNSINGMFVINHFAKCLRTFIPGLIVKIDGIFEKEAWLDSSNLVSMRIPINTVDQQLMIDNGLDDDPKETAYGCMELVVSPPKGDSMIKRAFWWALKKKNSMGRMGMLTVPFIDDSIPKQGIQVEVAGADGRKKTFTIGDEKIPKIREVITGDGEPRLDNGRLRRRLSESIFSRYADEQIGLQSGWDSGDMREEIPNSGTVNWGRIFEQVNSQNGDGHEFES